MARKVCPRCKRLTGGSTTTCECGHLFAAEPVAIQPRAKRCAMCGTVNHGSVSRCECGAGLNYDPQKLRAFLVARRRHGRRLMAGAIAIAVVGIGVIALSAAVLGRVAIGVAIMIVTTSVAMARQGSRVLGVTRVMLADLDGESAAIPAARVVDHR